jgi:RNA polymerase sigma factor (sigma-70 family)
MTGRRSTLAWLGDPRFAEELQPLYDELEAVLMGTFARKFGMPAHDAEALLENVFLAFVQVQGQIDERQKWLVVSACEAAALWQRTNGRGVAGETQDGQSLDELGKAILQKLSVRDVLAALPAPQREAVRLCHFEKLTFEEIGARMGMTPGAAEELVNGGVRRLLSRRKP